MNRATRYIIALVVVSISLVAVPVLAASNNVWQRALPVRVPLSGQVLYGTLGQTGDSAFYRWRFTKTTTQSLTLSVPTWASVGFQPQIVVYQPESETIGPLLPMEQPPNTAAVIYPAAGSAQKFSVLGFIRHRVILQTTLTLPPGQYYFAVYNAGPASGRWRLQFDAPTQWTSLWQWPAQWWHDQTWFGLTWESLFLPLWLFALVIGMWLLLFRKRKVLSKKPKA